MITNSPYELPTLESVFAGAADHAAAIPIYAVRGGEALAAIEEISPSQRKWAVANDFKGPDHLYRNNRDGTFTDITSPGMTGVG